MISMDKECTACGACVQICTASCIYLSADSSGVVYPIIERNNCIKCNACTKVCHLYTAVDLYDKVQHAYAVVNNSDLDLSKSTSGGAFSAIAKYVLNKSGVVYGCAYVEHLKAKHIRIDSADDLEKLNGSKYVQSDIGDCYLAIQNDLNNGLGVFFSGTPCQVSGLKTFLGKKYEKLITADIVCHGVAPQKYFDKYIEWLEQKIHMNITDYSFRSKDNSGWSLAGVCKGIDKRTGKAVKKNIYYYNEFYYYYFLKGHIYRDSCYSCKYACSDRIGDFTLGDLWGIEILNVPFRTSGGCSLVLTNNQKAATILHELDCSISEISMENALKHNKQLISPSTAPAAREQVVELFSTRDAESIYSYFLKETRIERILGFLKYHTPNPLKRIGLALKYKLRRG